MIYCLKLGNRELISFTNKKLAIRICKKFQKYVHDEYYGIEIEPIIEVFEFQYIPNEPFNLSSNVIYKQFIPKVYPK